MNSQGLFEKLRAALESAGIPYMITGSFATAAHGVPRATNDIDVVIAPTEARLVAMLRQFPQSEFYSDQNDALEALRRGGQFNIIDQNAIWKIDFIIRKDRPFSIAEFDRRQSIDILGVTLHAATAEDLLIAKLEWAQRGESERQLRDAAGIIAIQRTNLDLTYVERWVTALGLEEQWDAAKRLASTEP